MSFLACVQHVLVPTLHPGDRVVLDDLVIHKQAAVRTAIETVGAAIHFLPPYSPDLNPIELVFAKLRAYLRTVRPRTFDHVCQHVAIALGFYLAPECARYLHHCGYTAPTRS